MNEIDPVGGGNSQELVYPRQKSVFKNRRLKKLTIRPYSLKARASFGGLGGPTFATAIYLLVNRKQEPIRFQDAVHVSTICAVISEKMQ